MEYEVLYSCTVVELRKLAREMDVRIPSSCNKAEICMRLLDAEAAARAAAAPEPEAPVAAPVEAATAEPAAVSAPVAETVNEPAAAGPADRPEEISTPTPAVRSEPVRRWVQEPPRSVDPVRRMSRPTMRRDEPSQRQPQRGGRPAARTESGTDNAGYPDGSGILETRQDGYGYLRAQVGMTGRNDIYISGTQIRRFNLKPGDLVEGKVRPPREGDRCGAMVYVCRVNGTPVAAQRSFEPLVPTAEQVIAAAEAAEALQAAAAEPERDEDLIEMAEVTAEPESCEAGTEAECPADTASIEEQITEARAEAPEELPEEPPVEAEAEPVQAEAAEPVSDVSGYPEGAGMLELQADGYGYLRAKNCLPGPDDIYISIAQIRRFNLKQGDWVEGKVRPPREGDRFSAMIYVSRVNGCSPEEAVRRRPFESLIPIYPDERLRLENLRDRDLSLRLIDILAPIGKGQRGMIVSQPKAGKTTMIKKIANAIADNSPECKLIVLLIDERPEEVTDMKRSIRGDVIYSTFDEAPENHTRVSEMVLEHAQRLVEMGQDVVILLDSITRLARAYNLVIPPTGRSLSGGMDPGALYRPKKFFGAARNIENGGSLTIIATALVDTGSRMDDVIFEEFKGTGNMELHLDRKLSEKRIFPAIDLTKSGTRREELLLTQKEQEGAFTARRMLSGGNAQQSTELLIGLMEKTVNNEDFLSKIKGWLAVYEKEGFR